MDLKKFAICSREYGTVMIAELSDFESEQHLKEFINERKVIDVCGPLSIEPVDYLKEESLAQDVHGKVLAPSTFFLPKNMKMVLENGKVVLTDVADEDPWKRWI